MAQTVPSVFNTTECRWPNPTSRTPVITRRGVAAETVEPTPSWPNVLRPIAQRLPSCLRKNAELCPATTRLTPLMSTGAGANAATVVPLPNWPKSFWP